MTAPDIITGALALLCAGSIGHMRGYNEASSRALKRFETEYSSPVAMGTIMFRMMRDLADMTRFTGLRSMVEGFDADFVTHKMLRDPTTGNVFKVTVEQLAEAEIVEEQ